MIAGEVYGGSGNDSVLLGGSLGGVVSLAQGAIWWRLLQMLQLCWAGRRTTRSASVVRCVTPAWWWIRCGHIAATGQLRGSTVYGGDSSDGAAPLTVQTSSALAALLSQLFTAIAAPTACSLVAMQHPRRSTAVWITIW